MTALVAQSFNIKGIVQGVGFRPWIFQLAKRFQLTGHVLNDGQGVSILVQGPEMALAGFRAALDTERPPLCRIDELTVSHAQVQDLQDFTIAHSSAGQAAAIVTVGSDKSSCDACLAEIRDPNNRHFGYPFTNCTHCGPRYTIIRNLPYDRHNTAMAGFALCDACRQAYEDPMDRRYHAQPVSCPKCGPELTLRGAGGEILAKREQALAQTIALIEQGKILAIKGLGGFHLICDAGNHDAVTELRRRKYRPAKPLALMMPSIEFAKQYAEGSSAEWQLLSSQERPIVLMAKKQHHADAPALSSAIAPDIDRLGLFLPYTPLHTLLLDGLQRPLVATSANRSGEPIITDGDEVLQQLGKPPLAVVDAILDHNRPIINGCDDSVVQMLDDELQVLRLARGYAPLSLPSKSLASMNIVSKSLVSKNTASKSLASKDSGDNSSNKLPSLLAVGPQQKNTLALNIGNQLYLSPHIGDLFSVEAEGYFERTLQSFQRLYHFEPEAIIRDKHPDYASSRWAERQGGRQLEVQHHFAHLLAVMAANDYSGKVLGFSFDGTGLGDDNKLWGGELLLADCQGFQRLATLSPMMLLGGEQAIREPWRLLYSLLLQNHGIEELQQLAVFAAEPAAKLANLGKIASSGIGPKSHSIGRLFDAAAALLANLRLSQYEGQAGIILETLARRAIAADKQQRVEKLGLELKLELKLEQTNTRAELVLGQWQSAPLFSALLQAWRTEPDSELLALAFIQAIGKGIITAALKARNWLKAEGIDELPLVLSGGVFQSRLLSEYCHRELARLEFHRLKPGLVPVNDGGIALGQLWYGLHQPGLTQSLAER
ncbi:carbamoyltransferase HypF [Shewanella algae]|uniref:Carbamoyltransferase HypF n=1 Tax=Shewanella algae TaxID=38313 RepID=A0AAD1KA93_9GAMM|nr:carbamoyltransferase HypF [Shewanella algae]MBO2595414.1 carbamoyltransferase HypF [Shewanella algae]MBO2666767.1 carbamoyltransferase HypF [Shewanella algae]BCV45238.1 carbamoyltransferase HypF [Shewanella algae]